MNKMSPTCYIILLLCFVITMQSTMAAPPSRSRHSRCLRRVQYYDKESKTCKNCTRCGSGHGFLSSCTRRSDTKCEKCVAGFTYSTTRHRRGAPCYACKQCSGRAVLRDCTPTSNTICGECPLGTYWDAIWNECQECSFCYNGHSLAHDPVVTTCMRPEIPNTHWCVKLSYPPYLAPRLSSTTFANGRVVFYADSIHQSGF